MIISTTPDSATAHASSREDLGIDKVAEDLAVAFGGSVRREVIERVVSVGTP